MTSALETPSMTKPHAVIPHTDPAFGRVLNAVEGRMPVWNESLEQMLLEHSFLIFRGVQLESSEDLLAYGKHAGTPLTYAFGQIFELKAASVKDGKTQLSDRAMSIHQDSVLPVEFADIIMMYVWSIPSQGGESLLCDNRKFLSLLQQRDPALYDFFIHAQVQYKNHTGNYYAGEEIDWVEKPTMRGHPLLDCTMPFFALHPLGDPHCNFSARFAGLSQADSDAKMQQLDTLMRDPEVMIEHQMQQGDFIIFDNLLISHGRNGFTNLEQAAQERHVSRVQIARL